MYALTGQAVARFRFQGEYDFVLGFAWIPWVLAASLAAVRSGRPRWVALAAVSLVLVFFSGNVYYAYYTAVVMVLFAVVAVVGVRRGGAASAGEQKLEAGSWPAQDAPLARVEPAGGLGRTPAQDASVSGTGERLRLVLHLSRLRILAFIAVFALGLAAIQLLPLVEFWPSLTKQVDPQLAGSHTFGQILSDYLSRDPWRPDAAAAHCRRRNSTPTPASGSSSCCCLHPWAVRRVAARCAARSGRSSSWGALVLFALAWISVPTCRGRASTRTAKLLNQFRYPRMLISGALGLLALGGLGLDAMLASVRPAARRALEVVGAGRRGVAG